MFITSKIKSISLISLMYMLFFFGKNCFFLQELSGIERNLAKMDLRRLI